jgi:SPP1 gp7 family putative phage head morphogenesis protein
MRWRDLAPSWLTARFAADVPAAPELGEVAYADIVKRMFGDPKKAFPVYNPSEVASKKGIRYFSKMARDDQIKAALALKRYAVMAGGWAVNSPAGQPKDWEPTAFVEECLCELSGTFESAVDGILSKFTYGFSLTEKVWAERDNMIVLDDLKTRHPYGIVFEQDAYGNILGITQGVGIATAGDQLPAEKFVLCVHDGQFSNPYGNSDLESAYRPWWIKENSYKWMAMLLEKLGIPPIFISYDSNTIKGENLTNLKAIVSNMQAATNALLPRGATTDTIDFWAPEIAGNVSAVFSPAIKMLNEDIARSILMPALLGLTPDTNVGSQARSTVHFDIFMMIVEREQRALESLLNRRVVRHLVDYNFSGLGNERPYLQFLPMSADKKVELFKVWSTMVKEGTVSRQVEDEAHIRETLRMPELTDETIERREGELENGLPDVTDTGTGAGTATGSGAGSTAKGTRPAPSAGADDPEADTYAARGTPEDAARRDMDRIEKTMLDDVRAGLTDAMNTMAAWLRRQESLSNKQADTFTLRKLGDVQAALEDGLRSAFQAGAGAMKFDMGLHEVHAYDITREGSSYAKAESFYITGVMRDDLTQKAKRLILDAVANGEPLEITIEKAKQMFMPYLGMEDGVADDVVKPYRLETILRTNVTKAYNKGRLASMQDPEVVPFLAAVRFSAILDTRTTEQCQLMHGKYFKLTDPELARAAPPLHFNCRSILVPVTRAQAKKNPIPAEEFVTPSLLGKVEELSNAGMKSGHNFYSLLKPVCGGSDLEHLRRYASELGVDLGIEEGAEL